MKVLIALMALLCLFMTGCGQRQATSADLISVKLSPTADFNARLWCIMLGGKQTSLTLMGTDNNVLFVVCHRGMDEGLREIDRIRAVQLETLTLNTEARQ